jgi:hypothetical protein|tara:strand:- start:1973 stop:2341 length:369 start_codon:yes stop_codon:yes gene_type:complete
MANEIRMDASLQIEDQNFREAFTPGSLSIDLASPVGAGGTQTIGATYEAVVAGDTTDGGVYFFRNVSNSINVEIGIEHSGSTFVAFLLLKPGEFSVGRLSSKTIYAKAASSTATLQYRLLSP